MSTKMKINSQIFQDSNNTYYPKDEAEVSNLIKEFHKKNLPTEIVGTDSKSFIGNKTQASNKISLSKLSGIMDYFPEELYIKIKAGTPLEDVEKALEKNNQELAFEPIDFGFIENGKSNKGTVAGCLSCNYAGSRRFKVGSVRDHVLGFQGINGKGDIIKSGGTVVKNVTGYDLSKLVTGSFGTLSVLTEITLKVLPKKSFSNTVVIDVKDNKTIYDLFDKIAGSSSEVSGAAFVPEEPKDENYFKNRDKIFKFNDLDFKGSFLAFRVEGDKVSINEKIKSLTKELQLNTFKTFLLDSYQSEPFWKKINNLELFEKTKKNMKIKEIKKTTKEFGGYLTIIKTSADYDYEESIFTIDEVRLIISKKIKESFDPKRILNPGKMYRGV